MSAEPLSTPRPTLGSSVRSLRKERGWSLMDAAARTGLSVSTLSKIENGQRSLTYDKLVQLADALEVDIARLFANATTEPSPNILAGRRSVQRPGDGFRIESGVYTYTFMAEDLIRKRFSPVVMELHARSVQEFDHLLRHEGDEYAFVLEGEIELHTEAYAPLRLAAGESVYFESSVGHAYVNAGDSVARILTIASTAEPRDEHAPHPVAKPRATRPRAKKPAQTGTLEA
jgi:transcriptional regulator with XRE-family HTH domain